MLRILNFYHQCSIIKKMECPVYLDKSLDLSNNWLFRQWQQIVYGPELTNFGKIWLVKCQQPLFKRHIFFLVNFGRIFVNSEWARSLRILNHDFYFFRFQSRVREFFSIKFFTLFFSEIFFKHLQIWYFWKHLALSNSIL